MAGRLFTRGRVPAEGEVDLRVPIGAFGRYDLLEKIADGRDTEVFVARSDGFVGLFRQNALKRLKPALCSDVALVSRFIEEARLAVRVEHPGTVAVDDFGRVGGVYYIAFELVDGITVEELIERTHGRQLVLDARLCAAIVRGAAHAVDHVHRQKRADGKMLGLVHGDLQPKHVLVSREGKVKVGGFAAPSIFVNSELCADVLGVRGLRSQAPEVFSGAAPGAAADVWSLGVLMWELLVGRPLFEGSSAAAVRQAVLDAEIKSPGTLRTGVPAQLLDVVEGALQRDVRARTADAKSVAAALDGWLTGAGYTEASMAAALIELDDDDVRTAARNAGRVPTLPQPGSQASATQMSLPPQLPLSDQETKVSRAASARAATRGKGPAPVEMGPAEAGTAAQRLAKDPGVWGLVRVADRTAGTTPPEELRAMYRTSAVLFASRGQLAQALCAYDGARALSPAAEVSEDFRQLAELGSGGYQARQHELARVGGLHWYDALREQTEGGVDRGAAFPTPFLSALSPDGFARLASLCTVRRVPAGRHILQEGEPGSALFAVGEGRLVVTCTPSQIDPTDAESVSNWSEDEHTDPGIGGRKSGVAAYDGLAAELASQEDPEEKSGRVFLSALTAGDIFGEFSFLTGRPRSASVEAVTSCRVVEISRDAVGGLLDENLQLRDALEAFYKERVLEWMLAKNEVFSLLEPERRRALLAQCGVYDIPKGKMVVREGELHDAMYFIKRGEVEVTLDDSGVEVFINKLGAGEFFGEIAALEGGPRRASVRAVTDLEVFRITRADLGEVLDDAPDVRERLEKAMQQRSAELRQRIAEQRKILGST